MIGRADRGATTWLFLTAGCGNGLLEAMADQGCTQRPVVRIDGPTCSATQKFSLVGPTGDCSEVIARDVELPSDTGLGDRLVFADRGAGYSRPRCGRYPDAHPSSAVATKSCPSSRSPWSSWRCVSLP